MKSHTKLRSLPCVTVEGASEEQLKIFYKRLMPFFYGVEMIEQYIADFHDFWCSQTRPMSELEAAWLFVEDNNLWDEITPQDIIGEY